MSANEQSKRTLRDALARKYDLSKTPRLTVNGQPVEFSNDWMASDQAHRKGGFFGAIPVPLPPGLIQKDNEISLTFPDNGGRLSTVVMEAHSLK